MKIAFFGSSLVSSFWNGAATYYRGILKALARRGHEIVFYEPDAFGRQQRRDLVEPPEYASVVVYPADSDDDALAALEQARDADLVVKASGVGVFDNLLERAVLDLRRQGQTVLFWDVDAPATLDRVRSDPGDPFRELIPRYDAIFTYGGGDPVVRAYESLGARLCSPVYNALDPETHFQVSPDPRFEGLLSFLGNRLPDREERVFEFFFRPVALLPDRRFILGGAGWQDPAAEYSNVEYLGHVYTADHNAFNSTPLAVLNISRASMARYGYSPATRVFEAAGAAACIVTDRWAGLELFLEPGRECLAADNGDEVADHLLRINVDGARAIGEAARKRVLAEHTYDRRAALVETLLDARLHAAAVK